MALEPPARGRARSVGNHTCDRCHRTDVTRIRVHWPDGRICGVCFTTATHTFGTCPDCLEPDRMLPGRNTQGKPNCRHCAGITTQLVCARCGREAERFRAGSCARCVITEDLTALLQPRDNISLHRLIRVLTDADRPESIYTYMRGAKARELLTAIGERRLTLRHDAFDALPRSTAAEHLRALLMHHGMLPQRGPEPVARFERWLAQKLAAIPDDSTRTAIERFATWHHLNRVRKRAEDPAVNLETVTHAAKQEITEAAKLLSWLADTHGADVSGLTQAHVDDYLSDGPSTRKHIRNYVRWLTHDRPSPRRRLEAPHREAKSVPMLTQTQRIDLVRNCLEWERVGVSLRVAGLILLLWAHPLNKIVMLRRDRLQRGPTGMTITLGAQPAAVPEAITDLFWRHAQRPSNQQTTNTATEWLFPGTRAGAHLHPGTLSTRLKVLGIDAQRARNATLRDLVHDVDARSLIDLLGYSPGIISQHAARTGVHMSDYISLKGAHERAPGND
ncbi:hypothetical protein A8L33_10360 [Microbacterium aurantiacum]|uniref:Site-specific recombinase XerD n=1 Tax=Microbacterium aurantiacum TaxID=162393 RepID=A0A0M8MF06_9MICO|nr:hypothetical protein A8L33_10360 [Microbacterium chocolatum]KOS10128.1 hypothetical protein XI38_12735 [Microbacterium chocolatum]